MAEISMRFPDFRTKALTLSYDDGTVFDRQMVAILNQHHIKCTFNLNSQLLGRDRRIAQEEVPALYAGHEIAVHTATHPHLENLSAGTAVHEILSDRLALEKISGEIIDGMAYPFGLTTAHVAESARACGIGYARTVQETHAFGLPQDFLFWHPTCHHSSPKVHALIDAFLEDDDWEHPWRICPRVFYLWGHSYEFENCFEILEALCEKLGDSPNVWYVTNGELYRYVCAYRALRFSANGEHIHNPTATDLYAYVNGKNILLPAGKTVCISDTI